MKPFKGALSDHNFKNSTAQKHVYTTGNLLTVVKFSKNYYTSLLKLNIYGLLTKREVKMAGYWPSSFFACLWTETKSRSINTQKKNEANILPS